MDTRERIFNAIKELLITSDLNHITATSIAEKAGIDRGTFYYYFADKYQAFIELYQEKLGVYVYGSNISPGFFSYTNAALNMFYNDQQLFEKVIKEKATHDFIIAQMLHDQMLYFKDSGFLSKDLTQLICLYALNVIEILSGWASRDFSDSIEDIIRILTMSLPYPLAKYYYDQEKDGWPQDVPTPV